ncbi:MAG: bifunctional homocysteine S-methyltransferase/methylenetetrahydrofolate reductase [Kiritimatiellia bacterium]
MTLLEKIRTRPLLFDGAMGTMIYHRGVFLNACYDELSLTRPDLIHSIHAEYVDAGVDVIETNSFGANRIKLAAFGLADQVAAINRAAVRLARQAAQPAGVYVAASVGPCLEQSRAWEDGLADELEQAFAEQLDELAAAGVDLIALETFHDQRELQLAARLARARGLPVMASFVPTRSDPASVEEAPEIAWARALDDDENVDLIGANCGLGPSGILYPLQRILRNVSKPVIVMPNAGGPSEVGGRMLYLNSPEYFTEFAKRYIEMGVRGVGGCCGTTPAHLRMAARAVKSLSGVKTFAKLVTTPEDESSEMTPPAATAEKSDLGAALAAGRPVRMVELLPPRTVAGLPAFLEKCRVCREAGVDAVNLPDGPRASARISVLVAAMIAQRETGMTCLPHYCCRDRNLIGMQADLLGGQAVGLHNWLLITGDPPKLGDYPDATGVFDLDAIGLCQLATNLNHGCDAAGHRIDPPAKMLLGVGVNPVAVEPERELERFFAKIEAGAEFAITQPVFDPEALLRFLERLRRHARQIPIIAGCYPLTSLRNAEFMNEHVPGVVVPPSIMERLAVCCTRAEGLDTGVEIACDIFARIAGSVQGYQVSAPLGNLSAALRVLQTTEGR